MVSYGLDKRVNRRTHNTHPTRSNRVRFVRTPGNKLVLQRVTKKTRGARTPQWLGNKKLSGIKVFRASKTGGVKKSKRTVSRPYGGVLGHDTVKEKIIRSFLVEEQKIVKRVLKMKKQESAKAEKKSEKKDKKDAKKQSKK